MSTRKELAQKLIAVMIVIMMTLADFAIIRNKCYKLCYRLESYKQ